MLYPFFNEQNAYEAGIDEAGRGCLAGAVVAAAIVLPKNFDLPQLNDSKKLTDKQRYRLRPLIEQQAISFAIGIVGNQQIDAINILNATFEAMNLAINQLTIKPNLLLIDGNRFKNKTDIAAECIVGGDAKFASIAAASVLAKTYRDDLMLELHKQFPLYNWHKNKAYPTKEHRKAIALYGLTPLHRTTFRQLSKTI